MKYISFDLDGTLTDYESFDRVFWLEEIPKLYAKKHGVSLKKAKKEVLKEYSLIDSSTPQWYTPHFWFKHFGFEDSCKKIISPLKVKVFDDVKPVLKRLKKDYKLIVLTNSTHEFIRIKMKEKSIKSDFVSVYSAVDDFKKVKNDPAVYEAIVKKLKIGKDEIIHVGDGYEFDYKVPMSVGIRSYFLDRNKKRKGKYIVWSLKEFEEKLRKNEV